MTADPTPARQLLEKWRDIFPDVVQLLDDLKIRAPELFGEWANSVRQRLSELQSETEKAVPPNPNPCSGCKESLRPGWVWSVWGNWVYCSECMEWRYPHLDPLTGQLRKKLL